MLQEEGVLGKLRIRVSTLQPWTQVESRLPLLADRDKKCIKVAHAHLSLKVATLLRLTLMHVDPRVFCSLLLPCCFGVNFSWCSIQLSLPGGSESIDHCVFLMQHDLHCTCNNQSGLGVHLPWYGLSKSAGKAAVHKLLSLQQVTSSASQVISLGSW